MAQGKAPKKKVHKPTTEDTMLIHLLSGALLLAMGVLVFLAVVVRLSGDVFMGLRAASYGLTGALAPVLAVFPLWGGVLVFLSINRKVHLRPFLLCLVLFLLLLATVYLLTFTGSPSISLTDYVLGNPQQSSYLRALGSAYTFSAQIQGAGGGLLGMVIAWPLWRLTSAVFGGVVCILLMLLVFLLMLNGHMNQLRDWVQRRRNSQSKQQANQQQEWLQWQQQQQQAARAQAMQQPASAHISQRNPVVDPNAPAWAASPAYNQARQAQAWPQQGQPQQAPWAGDESGYGFPPANSELNVVWPTPPQYQPNQPNQQNNPPQEEKTGLKSRLSQLWYGQDAPAKDSEDSFSGLLGRLKPKKEPEVPAEEPVRRPRPKPQPQPPVVEEDDLDEDIPVETPVSPYARPVETPAPGPAAARSSNRPQRSQSAAPVVPSPDVEAPIAAETDANDAPTGRRRRADRQKAAQPQQPAASWSDDDTPPWDDDIDQPEQPVVPTVKGRRAAYEPELNLRPARAEEKLGGDGKAAYQPVVSHPYVYPGLELLEEPMQRADLDPNEDGERARKLEETLASFRVDAVVRNITHGPAVSRFELELAPGIQVNRVTKLADNIAMNMAAKSVRIEAPIPGKSLVGVEIPNRTVATVTMREVMESPEMRKNTKPLAVALGKDIAGTPVTCDLAKMPHLLIAGATGSGKSVCINSIITSLIYRCSPKDVRLILVDPKVVELQTYNGIPHLLLPVVSDPHKASGALAWAVDEMMDRYKRFEARKVRNLDGYNQNLEEGEEPMPRIVIIIDELADLMMVCKRDVEERICRLAQLARAAGMHLIVATQRPSVDVITGLIKANIPSRIAFKVTSYVDSRTILDRNGAEQLLGWGDMLYQPTGQFTPTRIQGCFLSDKEVNNVADFIRAHCPADYDPDIMEQLEHLSDDDSAMPSTSDFAGSGSDSEAGDGSLLQQAIEMAVQDGQVSTSTIQRRLKIGYARAGRLVDEMEKRGIVSQKDGAKPRLCLISREDFELMKGEL